MRTEPAIVQAGLVPAGGAEPHCSPFDDEAIERVATQRE
jgi:hypothetical protein